VKNKIPFQSKTDDLQIECSTGWGGCDLLDEEVD